MMTITYPVKNGIYITMTNYCSLCLYLLSQAKQ